MLKRLFSADDTIAHADLDKVEALLSQPSDGARARLVIDHLRAQLPGDIRGYVVSGASMDEFRFMAVAGYAGELAELKPAHGPWRDAGPRFVTNLIQELFTPNSRELRSAYGDLGLREPRATMVAPVGTSDDKLGAMILHKHEGAPFTGAELKLLTRWGRVLGGLLRRDQELRRSKRSLAEFARAFTETMEASDFSQLGHGQRVTAYAMALGSTLGMSRREMQDLYFAAMLHDIGKLGSDTFEENSEHPQRGANLVASSVLLAPAAQAIRCHHERWDGTGFPDGVSGQAIPVLARIVAVADQFDMLSSERGQALPLREVEKILEARAGHDLDPELVGPFINVLRRGKSTADLARLDENDLPF